jgi:nucleotidyltransferase/DNA polymerase involved in DNA repair
MSSPPRHIAHFDLDSFFVSVEILNNPSLKGKPVLVGGYERGVVAACSYEARKFGIQSAMPMKRAMQLCPHAVVTNASRSDYSRYSRLVTEIIASKVPRFEKASIDEFYIDLTGMDRFFGVSKYTAELRELIMQETGLPISCGLSSAKFISKMATNEAKPNGFLEIPHGREKDFLWPLPVEKINGVGKQTEMQLKSLGIYRIGDIARMPVEVSIFSRNRRLGQVFRQLVERDHLVDAGPRVRDLIQQPPVAVGDARAGQRHPRLKIADRGQIAQQPGVDQPAAERQQNAQQQPDPLPARARTPVSRDTVHQSLNKYRSNRRFLAFIVRKIATAWNTPTRRSLTASPAA